MEIKGKYCRELCDGVFSIELDLVELQLLDEIFEIAHTAMISGVGSEIDWGLMEPFINEFFMKKDALVCQSIDKKSVINKLAGDCLNGTYS